MQYHVIFMTIRYVMLSIVALYFVGDVRSTLAPPVTIYKLTTTPLPLDMFLCLTGSKTSENILQAMAFQCDT